MAQDPNKNINTCISIPAYVREAAKVVAKKEGITFTAVLRRDLIEKLAEK